MSNNSNNVHFSGERLICNPYLIIIVPRFARADNDKIRAANESFALKMNIIVILDCLNCKTEVFLRLFTSVFTKQNNYNTRFCKKVNSSMGNIQQL